MYRYTARWTYPQERKYLSPRCSEIDQTAGRFRNKQFDCRWTQLFHFTDWNWPTVDLPPSWWSRILLPEDVRMINILTPLNILPLSRRPHSNDSFSPSTKSLSLITVNWIESRTSVTENNTRSSSLYSKKNIQIGIHEYSRIIPMNKLTQFRVIGWDTIIITMGYLDHNQDHHHG